MKLYQSSEMDIANFRRRMILNKKLNNAAVKLQTWWRKVMPSRKPWYSVKVLIKYIESVSKITQWWRGFKIRDMLI
jgi:hypothetical protein